MKNDIFGIEEADFCSEAGCSSCHPTNSVKALKRHMKDNGDKNFVVYFYSNFRT